MRAGSYRDCEEPGGCELGPTLAEFIPEAAPRQSLQQVATPVLGPNCVITVKASTKFTNACLTFDELVDGSTEMVVGIGILVEGDGGGECSAFTSVDESGSAKVRTHCKTGDGKTKISFKLSECFETPIP